MFASPAVVPDLKPLLPEQFIISFWYAPPPSETTPERYAEIAKAGFNLVMPGEAPPADQAKAHNRKVLDLCRRFGMKALIADPRIMALKPGDARFETDLDAVIADYVKDPALYGYFLDDEPNDGRFPQLAAVNKYLLTKDPKHVPFVNLFPIVATPVIGGPPYTNDLAAYPGIEAFYAGHVERFLETVKPKLLSYDEYDLFEGGGIRGFYFANLEVIRRAALKHGVPFNNIVLVTPHQHPHGTYRSPSVADIRFLVYTTLAYGARGITFFTYWSPPGFGDAVVGRDGKPSRHYADVTELNANVRALAPVLTRLRSEAVYHTGDVPKGCKPLPDGEIVKAVEGGPAVVSLLRGPRGERFVMVVNKDMVKARTLTVMLARAMSVEGVSNETGLPTKLGRFDRVALRLEAGEGRLLRLRR